MSGDLPSWSEHRFLGSNGELDTVEEEDKEARGHPALLLRTNAGRVARIWKVYMMALNRALVATTGDHGLIISKHSTSRPSDRLFYNNYPVPSPDRRCRRTSLYMYK